MIKVLSHTIKLNGQTPESAIKSIKSIPGNLTAFATTSSYKIDKPDLVTYFAEVSPLSSGSLPAGFRFAWITKEEFEFFKSQKNS